MRTICRKMHFIAQNDTFRIFEVRIIRAVLYTIILLGCV